MRTSKHQYARNRPVRPVRRERAVPHLGAPRKCWWILCPVAISQSFTFLLQSCKALCSGQDFCPIHVPTLLNSTITHQRYIWCSLYHVENSCTFIFITHRCNIWLDTEAWTFKIAKTLCSIPCATYSHYISFSSKRTHLYNL